MREVETFDRVKAIAAQKQVVAEQGAPHFAPHDGICYDCCRNIYELQEVPHHSIKTGISIESAGRGVITGCPHCSSSYCD